MYFPHLLHKCITYLSLFLYTKKVFTIQPCRDQAQTCQQDYICRFLYLAVYSHRDAVYAAHAPTQSFAAWKKSAADALITQSVIVKVSLMQCTLLLWKHFKSLYNLAPSCGMRTRKRKKKKKTQGAQEIISSCSFYFSKL